MLYFVMWGWSRITLHCWLYNIGWVCCLWDGSLC
jgi:hypothetical protein